MTVNSLHLLLTYECPLACDHCFVWSGPNARRGTLSLADLRTIVREAKKAGTVRSIFFEGGEPFLYYPVLLRGLKMVKEAGFDSGIVTNGYWGTTVEDAKEWLRPIDGLVRELSVSNDELHYDPREVNRARNATRAAKALGFPCGEFTFEKPTGKRGEDRKGAPATGGQVMFRGRAARNLTKGVPRRSWASLDRCPHEALADPQRVHIDPFGYVHLCNGIAIGNFRERPLSRILKGFRPREDPIIGPLLAGGPAALVRAHKVPHKSGYADECHLCYEARVVLRERFPEILAPDQVYGVYG